MFRNPHPSRIRYVGIFHFPLGQVEQIFLRHLPLLCALAQQPFPLYLRQNPNSTAEYQRSEFIDHSILLTRIVVARFSFNLLKKSRLRSSLLSKPIRTSEAFALLVLVSTVRAYRAN